MSVATAIVTADILTPELAATAVKNALKKIPAKQANSVLLYLSEEFASNPQPAIKAAAKAASTTQIMGCTATGIFTEDDWVMDGAAAAAMVFCGDYHLTGVIPNAQENNALRMTLVAPNAIFTHWLESPSAKFGGVSGDATGRGPFSVWQNAKGTTQGYCELQINGALGVVAASHGLRILGAARRISKAQGFDVQEIGNSKALSTLVYQAKKFRLSEPLPTHQLMAVYANKASDIEHGDYFVSPIISGNEVDLSVTLATELQSNQWLAWAIRDVDAAQQDIVGVTNQLKKKLARLPRFGLMFSSVGRGPYFYDGRDLDLALVKTVLPKMPIIGFYGNGEIAPILGKNTILPYSTVLGLFA